MVYTLKKSERLIIKQCQFRCLNQRVKSMRLKFDVVIGVASRDTFWMLHFPGLLLGPCRISQTATVFFYLMYCPFSCWLYPGLYRSVWLIFESINQSRLWDMEFPQLRELKLHGRLNGSTTHSCRVGAVVSDHDYLLIQVNIAKMDVLPGIEDDISWTWLLKFLCTIDFTRIWSIQIHWIYRQYMSFFNQIYICMYIFLLVHL